MCLFRRRRLSLSLSFFSARSNVSRQAESSQQQFGIQLESQSTRALIPFLPTNTAFRLLKAAAVLAQTPLPMHTHAEDSESVVVASSSSNSARKQAVCSLMARTTKRTHSLSLSLLLCLSICLLACLNSARDRAPCSLENYFQLRYTVCACSLP